MAYRSVVHRASTYLLPAAIALAAAVALAVPLARAQTSFDHSKFDRLLEQHVADGLVDYDVFAQSSDFDAYLKSLADFDPRMLPREEQLAFWINAYNAYTIELINKHEERKSIRNINKGIFGIKAYGPWKEKLAVVGGEKYGLDHIEQKIIRPEFKEPRIHFALVCAAMGCPPLLNEAYTGAKLDAQLTDRARIFLLKSPERNRIDVEDRTAHLSELFKFRDYLKDFGGSHKALGRYLAQFYPEGPEKDLLASGDFKVEWTKYDWSLNGQDKATASAGGR